MKRKAYGKINIGLRVLNKREDGFHEIETIMTRINIYDEIVFLKSDKVLVESKNFDIKMEDNLVYKIAMHLKEKYEVKKGIRIIINKRIPLQAGLGGGSSDAATSIVCLNKIWKLKMNKNEMEAVANKFGSDILFFLSNRPCFVYGRGEKLREIKIKKKMEMVLLKPNFGIITKEAFSLVDRFSGKGSFSKIEDELANGNILNLKNEIVNDLEKAIIKEEKYSKIEDYLKELYENGAQLALMSGSGSCVYGVFENRKKRNLAYNSMLKKNYTIYKICNV